MQNKQKGYVVPVLIVLVVLIVGGGIYYFSQKKASDTANTVVQTPVQTAPAQTTPTVNSNTTANKTATQSTPLPSVKAPVTPVVTTKTTAPATVAPTKNFYTNIAAGYSIELPQNWMANVNQAVSDPNEPQITGTYLSVKNQTADQQGFTFDIQTSTTKHQIDYYVQQYGKTPTYDDLFNVFIETQKSSQDQFVLQGTSKVLINGNQAYQSSATFSGGGGIQKLYVFYTSKNTYIIRIVGITDTWSTHESQVLGVVGTFKIQ